MPLAWLHFVAHGMNGLKGTYLRGSFRILSTGQFCGACDQYKYPHVL